MITKVIVKLINCTGLLDKRNASNSIGLITRIRYCSIDTGLGQ